MTNKKILTIGILILLAITLLPLIYSEDTWPAYNVCCEKTKTGAWCQNTSEENCNSEFRKTQTSCSSTSYCKPGCCYDSQEGLCMENTPQKVCNDNNGTWVDDEECSIPQCELGCCVLGTQASFVTLTRCKRLSGLFGLETNFRTDIGEEATCIAVASLGDEGACVYEVNYEKTCRFMTREECSGIGENGNQTSASEFFQDYLCSAEELATNCGPSTKTTCIEGKDEVYFLDTCGNPANIYDASKINDKAYWQKKFDKSESCGAGKSNGNAKSKDCGNCDYFKGSICRKGNANYGDYICSDLNCYKTEDGNDYKNGESWCIYDGKVGDGADAVGSRHYRHICINGEEIIEPCADYRAEICIQADISSGGSEFTEAACRINRWTDCIDQKEKDDCLNTDRRDCFWLEGAQFTGLASGVSVSTTTSGGTVFSGGNTGGFTTGEAIAPITGYAVSEDSGVQFGGGGACLPSVPKGLKFWTNGDADSLCSLGNSKCVVEYEKGLLDSKKKPIKNEKCLTDAYAEKMNQVCSSLGDCGAYVNIAGRFTTDGAEYKIGGKKQTLGQGILNEVRKRAGVKGI